jgi:hypothetical protein
MKALLLLPILGLALPIPTRAADPTLPERYLAIYVKINQAEHLEREADYKGSLAAFQDCYKDLLEIHTANPDWEDALVLHRLDDLKAKILDLESKANAPPPAALVAQAAPAQPAPVAAPAPATNLPPNLPPEVKAFQQALPRLETEQAALPPAQFASTAPHLHNNYPWKTNIIATKFWIGESGSTSGTASEASAWDAHWVRDNSGADNPYFRNGYATGAHASTFNPFYVALPFNDLTHRDLAQKWLPPGWHRDPKNGTPISSCKDRWLEIKNARGDICYAQWEDVGPGGTDHAAYVFGNEPPGKDNPPGLCVSPAVADYLHLAGEATTPVSWRFVEDENVRPGAWLKLDEQAVIYLALHHQASR